MAVKHQCRPHRWILMSTWECSAIQLQSIHNIMHFIARGQTGQQSSHAVKRFFLYVFISFLDAVKKVEGLWLTNDVRSQDGNCVGKRWPCFCTVGGSKDMKCIILMSVFRTASPASTYQADFDPCLSSQVCAFVWTKPRTHFFSSQSSLKLFPVIRVLSWLC